MRLAVVGASGRMGRAVVRLAYEAGTSVVCAVAETQVGKDIGELAGVGPIGTYVVDGLGAVAAAGADAVVDFSAPAVTLALAPVVASAGCALVTGTTGLGEDAHAALDAASAVAPVLWEPNMSVGIHLLTRLVAEACASLPDWDIEIVELHHRAKVDAPSGTALRLVQTVQEARDSQTRSVHGREGKPGPRSDVEIGVHALRGGDVVGDHYVHLLGAGERIEIAHRATSRDVFAQGALRAALWLKERGPGRYTFRDILKVR